MEIPLLLLQDHLIYYHIMKTIPNTLREHRKQVFLRQKDVARVLGFKSPARISKWEKGLKYPHVVNLFKMAKLYGVIAEELYFTDGDTLLTDTTIDDSLS